MLAGGASISSLPIAQYPDVAPPTINIASSYPGANAQTVENSVTKLIEQQLTGLDGLLYFSSASTADGDTGHGGPLNVQRMVRELVRMGAFGILLEDQTWPKRCGHMRGKSVIAAEEHAQKIRAAKEAKKDAPFIITARTDAIWEHGLDEAIRRARLYKEAGADILFVEGPRTREEIERIGKELPKPLAINLIEGGDTPILSLEELEQLGFFSVGFVLSGLYAAARALVDTYKEIRRAGTTDHIRDRLMAFDEFAQFIGLEKRYADDARFKASP